MCIIQYSTHWKSQEFFVRGGNVSIIKFQNLKKKKKKKDFILQINLNSWRAIFQGIIYYKFARIITKFTTLVTIYSHEEL